MKKISCILLAAALGWNLSAVDSVKGVRGNAAKIDGRKSYLADPSGKVFDYSKGFTVSLFCNADEWAQQAALISNAGSFSLRKRAKGNKGFYFVGNIGGHRECGLMWSPEKFVAPLGRWTHLALTYDPKTGLGTGYLNGQKVAVYDCAKTITGNKALDLRGVSLKGTKFMLGNGLLPYMGALDEVYIYGRVLSDAEIASLFRGEAPAGAQAAYRMDDPADIGKDSSGNGRHLVVEKSFMAEPPPRTGKAVTTDYLFKQDGLVVWSRPATEKNMPADRPVPQKQQTAPSANLAANEYESFQIAVSPQKTLKNLTLELSPLKMGGETLEAKIFTVRYVAIPEPSQTVIKKEAVFGEAATAFDIMLGKPGYYPDVLPPGNKFETAPAGESSAFWITVRSTPDQKAGIYRGTAKLTADDGLSVSFPVAVQVWDFALPEEFHSHNSGVARDSLGADSEALYRNMAEHHVSVTPLRANVGITVGSDDKVVINTAAFDKEAAKALDQYKFSVLYFPGWDFYNMPKATVSGAMWYGVQIQQSGHLTERFKKVFGDYLRQMSAHLEAKGWLAKTRITLVDEPWTAQDFNLCQEFSKLVKANAPKVKCMITKWPQPGLLGAPDIWCLGFFQHDRMREALKRGEALEWYPNWHVFIDRPLMDSRMIGFLMWKYQVTGILFWKLNHGWSNKKNLEAPRYIYPDGRVVCGSGLLIYPDAQNNPISSIRWEMMRDAFEDFEYFHLLDGLARKNPESKESKAALELIKRVCDEIVPNYEAFADGEGYGWKKTKWSFDAARLQTLREELAGMIEKLRK